MSDRLQDLVVFVRAAESGSFSRAARELGLSQPSVSRIIGELEARLGVTLRTTRRITFTDAGALFLDRAREILADIEDAEDAARGLDSLRGTIRLAIPIVYGTREIIPRLPKFLSIHPMLRVELSVFDQRQDLVAEGADVAIASGISTTPCSGRANCKRCSGCWWRHQPISPPAARRKRPPILRLMIASSAPVISAAIASRSPATAPKHRSMCAAVFTPIPAPA
jgi:DNA-binding transcriptional LysR family regulator